MGDNDEGSSNAAQSAQDDDTAIGEKGFLGRIFDALTPQSEDETPDVASGDLPAAMPQTLGLLNLRRMRVEDVAIPKADITAVPLTLSKDELVEVFRDCGLTRLPVYDGTLDTPVGFVNLKDFALKHGFNGKGATIDMRAMLRPLLYVPPSMTLGILLQKMQAERIHMALVIDEYGGTDGLVTIEDKRKNKKKN